MAQPLEKNLAAIETDLERARAQYAARSDSLAQLLDDIQKRVEETSQSAPGSLESSCALLEASLQTLRGRLLSRKDYYRSGRAFHRAVELFERHQADIEQQKSSTRFRTDWGIALHRIGRHGESLAILSKVCEGGVAPADAFGYLGYGELAQGRLQAAEKALRKGLEIAPADLTMSYYLARVLERAANETVRREGRGNAVSALRAAAEEYCRAGEIAWNAGIYRFAARDAVRALRIEPANERALGLATNAFLILGNPRRALMVVDRFLNQQPAHPIARGMQGVLLRELGEVDMSVEVLRSIPVSSPDLAWVRAQLAVSLSFTGPGNADEALEAAREAVTLDPGNAFAQRCLGLLHVARGEYENAISALLKAKELGGDSEELNLNLGRALIGAQDYQRAEKELTALIALNPRLAEAHILLAVCAEQSKNLDRAVEHYRRASQLAPEAYEPFVSLMNVLFANNLRQQALDEIETTLSGSLRYLALWYRAKFEIRDEKWETAQQTLREALKSAEERDARKDLPGILVDCGDALRHAGDYEGAKEMYIRAYDMDASRPDVRFGKAFYHCDVAEFEDAKTCVEEALASSPDPQWQPALWNLYGWSLHHLGETAAALRAYEQAFELTDRKNPWYRKGLGNVLMSFDRDRAKDHFAGIIAEQKYQIDPEPATEQPSGIASILGLLGWCNYRLGRYDEAIRLFETVSARYPDERYIHFDLGLSLLASRRFRLAMDAYQRGYDMTRKCQKRRQRGILYVALFDLADARSLKVVDSVSDPIFEMLEKWVEGSGVQVQSLPWLHLPSAIDEQAQAKGTETSRAE